MKYHLHAFINLKRLRVFIRQPVRPAYSFKFCMHTLFYMFCTCYKGQTVEAGNFKLKNAVALLLTHLTERHY